MTDYTPEALIEKHNLTLEGFSHLVRVLEDGRRQGAFDVPDAITGMTDGFKTALDIMDGMPSILKAQMPEAATGLLNATRAIIDLTDAVAAEGLDPNNVPAFFQAVALIGVELFRQARDAGDQDATDAMKAVGLD